MAIDLTALQQISIPYGAIKSASVSNVVRRTNIISIPYGAIKRY